MPNKTPLKCAAWSKNCHPAIIPAVSRAIKHLIPVDAGNVKKGKKTICILASGTSVPKTPSTVHIAPEAPNDEPMRPVAIFATWLKNDVTTQDDKYNPMNCSLPRADTIGPENDHNTNILHSRWTAE